jgi:hypothetical protein
MNIALYQIIIVAFAAIMIGKGLQNYISKAPGQTFLKLFVRLVIWGGMATVVIFPNVSNTLAALMGIQGNINAVILAGFLLVFLMIFKLLSAIEKLEQQLTALTRQKTLDQLDESE